MFARVVPLVVAMLCAGCAASRELQNMEPIGITSAIIAGSVTDSLSQQPIIGAELTLLTSNGEGGVRDQQSKTFTFAPAAAFRFDDVKPGSYVLRATAKGYRTTTRNVELIKAGERASVTFVLQRGE